MLSHLKRRIGVLTAVTVMAALVPVLSSSTVSAAPLTTAANPTDLSTYSACPTSANIPSAGFTDTTSTDVDCIAYYGITTGVTATTYEPAASVPRWQMALYLTRTATETGHTLGSGADQGFTDISGYSADIQTAINQLKQLTVTLGTTTTTSSPDDSVAREQMAMFVGRLLGLTGVGPNGAAVSSKAALTTNIGTLETQNDYNYTDIDGGGVSFEGHEAIEELYNLGVDLAAPTPRRLLIFARPPVFLFQMFKAPLKINQRFRPNHGHTQQAIDAPLVAWQSRHALSQLEVQILEFLS